MKCPKTPGQKNQNLPGKSSSFFFFFFGRGKGTQTISFMSTMVHMTRPAGAPSWCKNAHLFKRLSRTKPRLSYKLSAARLLTSHSSTMSCTSSAIIVSIARLASSLPVPQRKDCTASCPRVTYGRNRLHTDQWANGTEAADLSHTFGTL